MAERDSEQMSTPRVPDVLMAEIVVRVRELLYQNGIDLHHVVVVIATPNLQISPTNSKVEVGSTADQEQSEEIIGAALKIMVDRKGARTMKPS